MLLINFKLLKKTEKKVWTQNIKMWVFLFLITVTSVMSLYSVNFIFFLPKTIIHLPPASVDEETMKSFLF